jgi:pimeloyl-ACP methyl ester carboxylesterase
LSQIQVPTLILGADTDRLTKLEASVTMNLSIPAARLVTLAPAGHMGMVERHQEVNNAVTDFLDSLPQQSVKTN